MSTRFTKTRATECGFAYSLLFFQQWQQQHQQRQQCGGSSGFKSNYHKLQAVFQGPLRSKVSIRNVLMQQFDSSSYTMQHLQIMTISAALWSVGVVHRTQKLHATIGCDISCSVPRRRYCSQRETADCDRPGRPAEKMTANVAACATVSVNIHRRHKT